MRVEIVEAESTYDLERKINSKLSTFKDEDILDIKYSGNGNSSAFSSNKYSAMIIYKQDDISKIFKNRNR